MLRGMADCSVDSVVTDPPYGLKFMGRHWDHGVPAVDVWAECLRVLKPGGHLLSFGGSRTYHRLVVAIEDAGFEIRDQIMWIYGSGFPKSHNLDGAWKGWGTALKPAHEPICVARKPLAGTVAANVLAHCTGALNIDACRIATTEKLGNGVTASQAIVGYDGGFRTTRTEGSLLGRWPANLIHDGSEEVMASFPDANHKTGGPAKTSIGGNGAYNGGDARVPVGYDDSGSASRFFYCAKSSRTDRNEGLGCGGQPAVSGGATMRDREQADWHERNGNHHPTVKPTDLMAYLVRLVTPPGGLVLDPFMGSGSTGKAAIRESFQFVGIEREGDYVDIARARIEHELRRTSRLPAHENLELSL